MGAARHPRGARSRRAALEARRSGRCGRRRRHRVAHRAARDVDQGPDGEHDAGPGHGRPTHRGPDGRPPSSSSTPIVENRPSGSDQSNQVKVCNAYIDAFLQPGSPEEREQRLREWGTPQNVEQAKETDPRRLSSAKRKGDCTPDGSLSRPNQTQAHVQLTDGTWWAATLVKDLTAKNEWRVHALTREGH
ncbi:hypothetical protein GCM10027418_07730 [Mariniluteicoccus endophyticus]